MSLDTYRVTCSHGHDAVTLTGRAALDHVTACQGRKAGTIWNTHAMALRIWKPCHKVVKAQPWKAPKAPAEVPADFLASLPEWSTKCGIDVTHEYLTDETMGEAA